MKKVLLLLFVLFGTFAFGCDASFPHGIHGKGIKLNVRPATLNYRTSGSGDVVSAVVQRLLVAQLNESSNDTYAATDKSTEADIVIDVFVRRYKRGTGSNVESFSYEFTTFGRRKFNHSDYASDYPNGKGTLFTVTGVNFSSEEALLEALASEVEYLVNGWTCP